VSERPGDPGSDGRAEVVYDDDCPLCRLAVAWVADQDATGAFAFLPLSARPDIGVPPERLSQALHVRLADGRVLAGAEAVAAILARLPRRRGLAALARLPGAPWLYRVVARHRHLLLRRDRAGNRPRWEKR
jgi:predicted DCC family thiol-disulfide oxidoreductase YuxK